MKIIYVILVVFLGLVSLHAQTTVEETVSKIETVEEYAPKAGTVALGASANIANIFTNSGDGVNVPTFYLQCYVAKKTALRATFGINYSKSMDKYYVQDDAAFVINPLSNLQVVDTKQLLSNNYNTSFAIQQFVGDGKLKGFIGLQGIYIASTSHTSNAYANPMNAINPFPSSYAGAYTGNLRTLEINSNNSYSYGGGILAGFEYFVFPRLSIGGEISVNALYSYSGQTYRKSETVINGEVVKVDQAVSPCSKSLDFKTLGYASKDMKEQIGFYLLYHF
jgi:hypothetical protein